MTRLIPCCLKDERAAASVELALIAAVTALALLSAAILLGTELDATFSRIGAQMAVDAVEADRVDESAEQRWQRLSGTADPTGERSSR